MSLPKAYNRRIMDTIGARAVWLPGSARPLGAIVARREPGVFAQVGDLAEHGISFNQAPSQKQTLDLASSGSRQRIIQAGADLASPDELDPAAKAELKLEFSKKFEFVLKTPELMGSHITNLATVVDKAAQVPGWDFDDFCIVHEIYVAASFSFLGTVSKASNVSFRGTGAAITSFLKAGLSVGLTSSGKADVQIVGQGGPIAMALVRVRKNGDTDFDI